MKPRASFLRYGLWCIALLGWMLSTGCSGCGAPAKRACINDTDCAESAPKLFCFQGFCSEEQCKPGNKESCYEGTPSTLNRGKCRAGYRVCSATSRWSQCYDQLRPRPEICDREDNDCDGSIDNNLDCTCKPGSRQECYNGPVESNQTGVCKYGTQTCEQDNRWGRCLEQVIPSPEICDRQDNNCNGQIDEDINCECKSGETRPCYTSATGCTKQEDGTYQCQGTCLAGKQFCSDNNMWSACEQQVLPIKETCDQKDNDCDGAIDESCGCPKPGAQEVCYTGDPKHLDAPEGTCQKGSRVCLEGGQWSDCFGEVKPKVEVCNGKDDDCNGQIDDEISQEKECVTPGGKGPCSSGTQQCVDGKTVCLSAIQAKEKETCNNNIDDNCDGTVDEGCGCTPGASQSCYAAKGCERGKDGSWVCLGTCKAGTQYCQIDETWGQCVGAVTPTTEQCDGLDNNCNGQVDETWPTRGQECSVGRGSCQRKGTWSCNKLNLKEVICSVAAGSPSSEICDGKDNNCNGQIDEDLQRNCYEGQNGTLGLGLCRSGRQTCSQGTWGQCLGQTVPQTEVCDNKDNNCNGQIDESITQPCYDGPKETAGIGSCQKGTRTCVEGKMSACTNQVKPSTEICDGKDNDCNGQVDENLTQTCYTGPTGTSGRGLCKSGTQLCSSGEWSTCAGQVTPQTEICDGKDNDCNGQVDESLRKSCYDGAASTKGVGTCREGYQDCRSGTWTSCLNQIKPVTETCDNKDNNCDGKVDEGCTCKTGDKQSCGSDVGECNKGLQTCDSKGMWGPCVGEQKAAPETCDGKDNNCDGKIDETWTQKGQTCTAGKGACQRQGQLACATNGTGLVCDATPGAPQLETCDGKDNNCDGKIDENLQRSCYSGPSGTAGKGQCKTGTQTCTAGTWSSCQGEVLPKAVETCNNKDDDCDGLIDDGLTEVCYSGPQGTAGRGLCKRGTRTCNAGTWSTCQNEVVPQSETCDNLDNDCDGTIDEQVQRSCYTGAITTENKGECKGGIQTCTSGSWGTCTGETLPQAEVCDNKDNDCNGLIDDTLQRSCYPTATVGCTQSGSTWNCVGECATGQQVCQGGAWGTCTNATTPRAPNCNNRQDNDCDGTIDPCPACLPTSFVGRWRAHTASSDEIYELAFNPVNNQIASVAGDDKIIKLWKVVGTTATLHRTLSGHTDNVFAVAFSPDGSKIISGSEDQKAIVWSAKTGVIHRTLDGINGHKDAVYAVAFSHNGTQAATGSKDRKVKIWNSNNGRFEKTLSEIGMDEIHSIVFSPDGTWLAAGDKNGDIRLWNASTHQYITTLKGHTDLVKGLSFSPDSKKLASASHDNSIKVWDIALRKVEKTVFQSASQKQLRVAFSPNGRWLAGSSYDKSIRIWDTTNYQLKTTLSTLSDDVKGLAWQKDSKRIIGGDDGGNIHLWKCP